MKNINFKRTNPEQLSYVEFEKGDKLYQEYACKPMDELDNGRVFKKIFFTLLQVMAYGLVIYGAFLLFFALFGETGFYKMITDVAVILKITGSLLSLVSLIISAAALVFVFAIFNNRSRKLFQKEFKSLLDYTFGSFLPAVIIIMGETLAVLYAASFVCQLLGALTISPIYNPLGEMTSMISMGFLGIISFALFPILVFIHDFSLTGFFAEFMQTSNIGTSVYAYSNFADFPDIFKISLFYLVSAIGFLIVAYVVVEIYKYFYMLVHILIRFLPKFALPIAVRHRQENLTPDNLNENVEKNKKSPK